MADLEHLTKEFEKLHDSVPLICERIARVEKWEEMHPSVHNLEKESVALAFAAANMATAHSKSEIERRLEAANRLREQIEQERGTYVEKIWFENKHKDLETIIFSGMKTLSDRIVILEQWQWKVIGASVGISLVFSVIAALVGWLLRYH